MDLADGAPERTARRERRRIRTAGAVRREQRLSFFTFASRGGKRPRVAGRTQELRRSTEAALGDLLRSAAERFFPHPDLESELLLSSKNSSGTSDAREFCPHDNGGGAVSAESESAGRAPGGDAEQTVLQRGMAFSARGAAQLGGVATGHLEKCSQDE